MDEENSTEHDVEAEQASNQEQVGNAEEGEFDFASIDTPDELKAHPPAIDVGSSASIPAFVPPAPVERHRPARPPLIPRTVWLVVGILVALAVIVSVAWATLAASSLVAAPDVTGESEGAATTLLAQVGLETRVSERRFSARPAGEVLEQDPVGGTEMKRGETVQLVVSAGTEELIMPDVIGDGISLARGVLEERGLVVAIDAVPSDAASDTVLATTPAPGAVVRSGDVVRVQVAAPMAGGATLQPYRMNGVSIVIDPAPSPTGKSDISLEVARRLRSLLEASGATVRVLRSGTGSTAPDSARANAAQATTATAAIGLTSRARGTGGRTVTGPPATASSGALASAIANELAASVPPSSLTSATADSVLGSLSYPWSRVSIGSFADADDKASMADPGWADRLAAAIYTGIGEVFGTKEQ
ncbi:MAG TPA: PASTA domain-containing protein [Coriobacteriia bacterium]|nr:PASTA domain-containing protein [Coriobacteriia bacterium]